MAQNLVELQAQLNNGNPLSMEDLRNKVVLVVNTASQCGFTPQYKGLETLYQQYKEQGLVVLGFPCDQFAHQEPGTDTEIATFCERNFGVTFPLMAKVEVNSPGAHPVFEFVKERAPGLLGKNVKWNFTKFLVERDGRTVHRFAPTTDPLKMVKAVEKALRQ